MSILVATPCYGGMLTVAYLRGLFEIVEESANAGVDVNFLVTEGESLVSRARNNLVTTFLKSDYDTLAFIDADIELRGVDFIRLAKMSGVRGAAVCLKSADHSEMLSCWLDSKRIKRNEMPSEPFRVDYLGAAVMFIDRSAFEALVDTGDVLAYQDAGIGPGYDFFPCGVVEGTYLSEDYGFCQLLKSAGITIYCDPDIQVKHYGAAFWQA